MFEVCRPGEELISRVKGSFIPCIDVKSEASCAPAGDASVRLSGGFEGDQHRFLDTT